ncbi:hypothetical protein [Microvirga aerophila]|uniref:Uncharacterized protein n=1 Tax=Microvirga aerophila TaxID=670291 RepID=A0A512BL07_9HYPH|nr:hypothetical protein [Microvirga aerophila]GEO12598.1 hypothetical protein MAE02_02940 [Microvirga aerophila]
MLTRITLPEGAAARIDDDTWHLLDHLRLLCDTTVRNAHILRDDDFYEIALFGLHAWNMIRVIPKRRDVVFRRTGTPLCLQPAHLVIDLARAQVRAIESRRGRLSCVFSVAAEFKE